MKAVRMESVVIQNRILAPGTHEISLERNGFMFRAGEEIVVHGIASEDDRTYSLASGERESVLRLLIRVIPDGRVSPRLARLAPGERVSFSGPTGSFTLRDPDRPACLVATGTGVAPFVSMLRSHPDWRPILLHGVRHAQELYYREEFAPRAAEYVPCLSRDPVRPRRVTDALAERAMPSDTDIYLCGGQPMIRAARALLLARGHPPDRIAAETYYFW